ncbi:MAG: hypothetical protein A2X42_06490 [Candidatus Margulisbacteria bacterium GWF2_38_17]|nr:MAG: hypothetical protein A2X43_08010 [Candidatus Margulisbacteria bacterium GWD2_39_127]OGI03671.1 MAG: hypothetical protein A2X42_06490 [Candidatus Margulisbacteria bacterium GWF2_38_17]OGI05663.1 MAG: hypothetical protein A2X41_03540 [Candidatus Margulisbacteria bacterium GWE2_39_32]
MTYTKSWKSALSNNKGMSRLLVIVLAMTFTCVVCLTGVYADSFSVAKPTEKEQIYSINGHSKVAVECSLDNIDKLFINGIEVPQSNGKDVRFLIDVEGFGEKRINILAVTKAKEIEQLTRSITVIRTYPDIKDHWAKKEIEYLSTLGFINDINGAINFYPENPVSRIDLAKLLLIIKGINVEKYTKNVAQDVMPGFWGQLYVNAAINQNILNLDNNNNFYPMSLVSRTEAMVAVVRAFNLPVYPAREDFLPDVPNRFWAKDDVNTAMINRLFPAHWNLRKGFLPNYILTRGELAAILVRVPFVKEKIRSLEKNDITFDYSYFEPEEKANKPNVNKGYLELSKSKISANNKERVDIKLNTNLIKLNKRVKKVEIDLSAIGKLSHTSMMDDGGWNDMYSNDGIYTVSIVPSPNIAPGEKVLPIHVTDISGYSFDDNAVMEVLFSPPVEPKITEESPASAPEKQERPAKSSNNTLPLMIIPRVAVPKVIPIAAAQKKEEPMALTAIKNELSPDSSENIYIVVPGDTLLVVSYKVTGSAYRWKEIAQHNNIPVEESKVDDKISYFANIYVGQKILIPKEMVKKK